MGKLLDSVEVSFSGLKSPGKVPAWAMAWPSTPMTLQDVCEASPFPDVVVIDAYGLKHVMEAKNMAGLLAKRMAESTHPAHLVFHFEEKPRADVDEFRTFLDLFPNLSSRVDCTWGDDLEERLKEVIAKYYVQNQEARKRTATDALAEAREVIAVTNELLAESGRLSAKAIAGAFGLSEAKLAGLIGRTRQALAKTHDSPNIQRELRPYERVARLRAVLDAKEFKAWLERPNRHLDGHTPIEIIGEGQVNIVADLVESMLTGTSS